MATAPYTYTSNVYSGDGTNVIRFVSTEDGFLYEVPRNATVNLNSADLARLGQTFVFTVGSGTPVSPVRRPVEYLVEVTGVGEVLTRTGRGFEFEPMTAFGGGHAIQDEGNPVPARAALNFIGTAVTLADDAANGRTNVTVSGSGGGGGGHTVQDEGTPRTDRGSLNFIGAGVSAVDDAANNRTNIVVSGASGTEYIVAAAQDDSGDWWTFDVDDSGALSTTNVGSAAPAGPPPYATMVEIATLDTRVDSLEAGGISGIPPSLLNAKGDLIVATADNTAARIAVGSNNQVLTADSTQATGVKWAAPTGGGGGGSSGIVVTDPGETAPDPAAYATDTIWVEVY